MSEKFLDYHYGDESEQYTFYRIPKTLIFDPKYRYLSTDAKLLYGLMLDRMGLSKRNNWVDKMNRVYIYFTAKEVCDLLNCKNDKALKLLAELDIGKGIGLIERVKQGQGKPTKIYVKKFTIVTDNSDIYEKGDRIGGENSDFGKTDVRNESEADTTSPKGENNQQRLADNTLNVALDRKKAGALRTTACEDAISYFKKLEVQTSEKPMSGLRKKRFLEIGKSECNNTDINNTEYSKTEFNKEIDKIDRVERGKRQIKKQIEYDILSQSYSPQLLSEMVELMVEVMLCENEFIKIGSRQISTELVKERFIQLNSLHVEYIFECLDTSPVNIRNIKAYLLEVMFNAPATMMSYYTAKVKYNSRIV